MSGNTVLSALPGMAVAAHRFGSAAFIDCNPPSLEGRGTASAVVGCLDGWGIRVVDWHRYARQPGCRCSAPGAGGTAALPQICVS